MMALEEANGDTCHRRRRQTGWEVNQGWKKPSETQIIVVDDSQGWKKQKQTDDESGLTFHDEQPMETQIDDDTGTPTELEEGDDDSVFAELTHGAPPPPRARASAPQSSWKRWPRERRPSPKSGTLWANAATSPRRTSRSPRI